jgi:hypothetical protein
MCMMFSPCIYNFPNVENLYNNEYKYDKEPIDIYISYKDHELCNSSYKLTDYN